MIADNPTFSAVTSDAEDHRRNERAWYRPVSLPEEGETLSLCARHRAMELKPESFNNWPRDQELPPDSHFGTLFEVAQRAHCVFCQFIAKSVSTMSRQHEAEVLGCWIRDGQNRKSHSTSKLESFTTLRLRIAPDMVRYEGAFDLFDVLPLYKPEGPKFYSGRLCDASQFNMSLGKKWVEDCRTLHGRTCGNTTGSHPKRLLDLKEDRLAEIKSPVSYVCLSYVWGQIPNFFKTLKSNLFELETKGGLSRHLNLLPKSIRDAISLASTIGERYLWFDSLCIVQDDDVDKLDQIAQMDMIYSRAILTVVAAGGQDADAGLPGLSPSSRVLNQITFQYSPELTFMKVQPDYNDAIYESTWNERGWTYQERVVSKRCLFFTNHTVYYQCQKSCMGRRLHCRGSSDGPLRTNARYCLKPGAEPPLVQKKRQYSINVIKTPYFPEYCKIVADYTSRVMSFQTDRLAGMQGILNSLSRAYDLEFVQGLPESIFDASLLWQPRQDPQRVKIDEYRPTLIP
jgi:hypothetical protein